MLTKVLNQLKQYKKFIKQKETLRFIRGNLHYYSLHLWRRKYTSPKSVDKKRENTFYSSCQCHINCADYINIMKIQKKS